MICIGFSLVMTIYVIVCLALRKTPISDGGVLGSTPKSVRQGKPAAGSVKLSEPAINLCCNCRYWIHEFDFTITGRCQVTGEVTCADASCKSFSIIHYEK